MERHEIDQKLRKEMRTKTAPKPVQDNEQDQYRDHNPMDWFEGENSVDSLNEPVVRKSGFTLKENKSGHNKDLPMSS